MERNYFKFCMVCILVATSMATLAMGTIEDDEKDCADQLGNLAACMPYVSGSAKKPTPDCCEATVKVKNAKPKCLCVLIKESTDPSMGLPINTTLALQMPSLCNINAKVSECPAILKLAPNSPDAKIFQVANADSSNSTSTATGTSPVASTTSAGSSSSTSNSDTKTTAATAGGSSSYGGTKLGQSILVIIAAVVLL